MRKYSITIVFTFFISYAFSQYELNQLVNINVTKAPEASRFQKFGDIPVNYATGVPNISFPFYEVSGGNLKVPITLAYHASGIKVSEVASCVGLGFNLSAGGRINRVILDKDDDAGMTTMNFRAPSEYYTARTELLQNAANAFDPEFVALSDKINYDKLYGDRISDRYSLFLPDGTCVVFRRDYITGEFVQTPYLGLKIELPNGPGTFRVTDRDGIVYDFLDADQSGWNLTRMENANKTDYIEFVYGVSHTNSAASYPAFCEESGEWVSAWPTEYPGNDPLACSHATGSLGPTNIIETRSSPSQYGSTNSLVTKIKNSHIEVQFAYSGGRFDPGSRKLTDIKVIDLFTGNQIKKMGFNFSNFGTTGAKTWRLKLSSFSFISNDNSASPQTYTFNYYDDNVLPPYFEPNYHYLFHEDYWGYYNGSSFNTLMPVEMGTLSGTSRNPDPFLAKACTIKEIIYPTGGKTAYEFEGNFGMQYQAPFYGSQGTVGYGPGLRVKTIKNYTNEGTLSEQKTYEYESGSVNSIGPHLFTHDKRFVFQIDPDELKAYEKYRKITVSDPLESMSIGENPPMINASVKIYNGTVNDNTGYVEYGYRYPVRQEVNAYELDIYQRHAWQWDYGQESPLLKDIHTYKKNPSSPTGYTLLKQEINEYTPLKQQKYPTGIHFIQKTTYKQARSGAYMDYYQDFYSAQPGTNHVVCKGSFDPNEWVVSWNRFFDLDNLVATETSFYSASHLLTTNTEYILTDNGYLTNQTNYSYDSVNLLLKDKTITNSKGELVKTSLFYPSDFISQEPYTTMVNTRNMISPVIETKQFNGTQFLKSAKTNYNFWNNDTLISPASMESKTGTNNPEIRARYYAYDEAGNPLSVSKENDIKQTYIWGYNKQYPVAQVVGADYATVSGLVNQTILNNPLSTESQVRNELNNIRTGLAGSSALVTTYTYKPLIGISSQTDPNGRTIYYEYDGFNRLKLIRDQDGKIIKVFDYKYDQPF